MAQKREFNYQLGPAEAIPLMAVLLVAVNLFLETRLIKHVIVIVRKEDTKLQNSLLKWNNSARIQILIFNII